MLFRLRGRSLYWSEICTGYLAINRVASKLWAVDISRMKPSFSQDEELANFIKLACCRESNGLMGIRFFLFFLLRSRALP